MSYYTGDIYDCAHPFPVIFVVVQLLVDFWESIALDARPNGVDPSEQPVSDCPYLGLANIDIVVETSKLLMNQRMVTWYQR